MMTDLTNDIATKLEKYEKMREAQRRANKKYRQANPEKFREYSKRYYETHRAKKTEAMEMEHNHLKNPTEANDPPKNEP